MNRKPSLLVVFLTVFIDLIGFGIVVPLVPIYRRHYDAGRFVIGAMIALFSALQFFFSPVRAGFPTGGRGDRSRLGVS